MNRSAWFFLFYAVLSVTVSGQESDDSRGIAYFEKHVRPLLIERCLKCHSTGSETIGGNLLLDSRQGWIKGGDLGQAIQPGNPGKSLLLQAVNHSSDELEMPPDGKLSKHEISILEKWIQLGAPDPRVGKTLARQAIDIEQGQQHWAFQTHHDRVIPVPAESPGFHSENELDRFLFRDQATKKIRPVGRVSKRLLIRRVTLALTGLLPSPDEVEHFASDKSPDSFQRLIDRLLSSPRYGEKWGRHWLDVARYADSNGLDENIAHGNAWRYRDYVIRSFNADKPYSTFVREQLAGDRMPSPANGNSPSGSSESEDYDHRIATGFLSLGPKVLAEVDEQKMEMDIVDEQVDTVGRAFLAMTLGCARCHDHKFDPIRTKDYYALAGIFKSTRTMEHFRKIARWNEFPLASPEILDKQKRQAAELAKAKTRLKELNQEFKSAKDADVKNTLQQQINEFTKTVDRISSSLITIPTAMGVADVENPGNVPVHIRGSHLTLGEVVPRDIPLVFADSIDVDSRRSGRMKLANWMTDGKNPLVARVLVNRVWRWHFGRGIVATTDNFGRLGSSPSHPELLDWLANRFMADGWSIKNLHRLILTSSIYQTSSVPDKHNYSIDRDNQLFWRYEIERIEAESLRDALLQTAGMLELKMGGSQLHVKNREFLFDHTSKDLTQYNALTRSIYLPVIRNHLYDAFHLFDYSDASVSQSNRSSTTVAPQALFLMNSPLVRQAASGFAIRVLAMARRNEDRLKQAYLIAFGRNPSEEERIRDLDFIKQSMLEGMKEELAWTQLCHTILMSNEFLFRR